MGGHKPMRHKRSCAHAARPFVKGAWEAVDLARNSRLRDVLAALKLEERQVDDEEREQVRLQNLMCARGC
eukprot:755046-Pleurochrysis_carterae.AAC.1